LAATFKSNGTFHTTEMDASVHPQRNTVKSEICKEMAGDRNRPLGLLLERKKKKKKKMMMMMMMMIFIL
jgi:hypothetical protein